MKNSNPKGVLGIGLTKQGLFKLSEKRGLKNEMTNELDSSSNSLFLLCRKHSIATNTIMQHVVLAKAGIKITTLHRAS